MASSVFTVDGRSGLPFWIYWRVWSKNSSARIGCRLESSSERGGKHFVRWKAQEGWKVARIGERGAQSSPDLPPVKLAVRARRRREARLDRNPHRGTNRPGLGHLHLRLFRDVLRFTQN
jgi:hypothetical protein